MNAAKIITVQDYKHRKLMWMKVYIYSSFYAKGEADNIWVKDIMITQKGHRQKKISKGS